MPIIPTHEGPSGTSASGSPLRRWLDQRADLDSLLRVALEEPIPGGARWAYIFGSGLLFLFLSQIVTGVALALYYVPAANDAHVTVAYIVKVVSGGSFLRSLHSYGSGAMVVVLLLHTVQTFLYGSYKGRRELVWISGCALFALLLGMAFTGYLLPWDQKAYYATAVGTNVMAEMPGIGNLMKQLLRGGNQMGTITLSRFFVLHVFVLPGLIAVLIAAHVYLFRKAGPAGPIAENPIEPRMPVEPFYPRQFARDWVFALLLACVLGLLAYFFPVRLGPEANPADTAFLPRPDWYFIPMFEWLKFWPGRSALVGIVVMPAVVTFFFVAAPFLDRSLVRHPLQRPLAVGGFLLALGGIVALGVLSQVQDQRDPVVAAQMAKQLRATDAFMKAPFVPLQIGTTTQSDTPPAPASPAARPAAVPPAASNNGKDEPPTTASAVARGQSPSNSQRPARTAPPPAGGSSKSAPASAAALALVAQGKDLFTNTYKCKDCHGDNGEGTDMAPKLTDIAKTKTPEQILSFLAQPSAVALNIGMPAIDEDSDRKALVAFILSLQH